MRTEPGQMQQAPGATAVIGGAAGQPMEPEGDMFAVLFGRLPAGEDAAAKQGDAVPATDAPAVGAGAFWSALSPGRASELPAEPAAHDRSVRVNPGAGLPTPAGLVAVGLPDAQALVPVSDPLGAPGHGSGSGSAGRDPDLSDGGAVARAGKLAGAEPTAPGQDDPAQGTPPPWPAGKTPDFGPDPGQGRSVVSVSNIRPVEPALVAPAAPTVREAGLQPGPPEVGARDRAGALHGASKDGRAGPWAGEQIAPGGGRLTDAPMVAKVRSPEAEQLAASPHAHRSFAAVDKAADPTSRGAAGANPAAPSATGGVTGGVQDAIGMQLFASGAERLWQGRFHGQDVASGETGDGERKETLPLPRSGGAGAVPQDRFTTVTGMAHLSPGPTIPGDGASDPAELPPDTDLELAPLGWTSAGQPFLSGSPGAGPVPAGAIPHLAAQIAVSLHQLPGGAVEIALSPDELGNLKLKLQADPQDPERMIVHLVFDLSLIHI